MISEVTGVDSSELTYLMLYGIESLHCYHHQYVGEKRKKKAGRPRMDDRKAMSAIFYVLRTGCQWNALPRSLGASSTGT